MARARFVTVNFIDDLGLFAENPFLSIFNDYSSSANHFLHFDHPIAAMRFIEAQRRREYEERVREEEQLRFAMVDFGEMLMESLSQILQNNNFAAFCDLSPNIEYFSPFYLPRALRYMPEVFTFDSDDQAFLRQDAQRVRAPVQSVQNIQPTVVPEPIGLSQRMLEASVLARLKERKVYDFMQKKSVSVDNGQSYFLVRFPNAAGSQLVSKDNAYALLTADDTHPSVKQALNQAWEEERMITGRAINEFAARQFPRQVLTISNVKLANFPEEVAKNLVNKKVSDPIDLSDDDIEDNEKYCLVPTSTGLKTHFHVIKKSNLDQCRNADLNKTPTSFTNPVTRQTVNNDSVLTVTGVQLKALAERLKIEKAAHAQARVTDQPAASTVSRPRSR